MNVCLEVSPVIDANKIGFCVVFKFFFFFFVSCGCLFFGFVLFLKVYFVVFDAMIDTLNKSIYKP